jgi:hypothetical protein
MGGSRGRWVVCAVLVLLGGVTAVVGQASAASAIRTGRVFVVNALAGVTAQLSVDGSVVRSSVAAKSVVGPLQLPPGQHVLELRSGPTVVARARFLVTGGDSLDLVAHRPADTAKSPLITVFRNDLSAVGPGKTRLVVSHVAVAEPADLRLDGRSYFRNVANAESLSVVVPARSYTLDVVPTAAPGRTILAPVRISLSAGTLTRFFVFGNPDDGTADAVVQVLPVPVIGAGPPSSVHTGDGGQAAEEFVTPMSLTASLAAAVVVVGFGLAGIAGVRRGVVRSAQVIGSPPRS